MIKTTKMHRVASCNWYGVTETLYRHGKRLYMSIIDYRECDARLDGIYDELGVYSVDSGYAAKWAKARNITL